MTTEAEATRYAAEQGDDWDIAHYGEPDSMTHEELSRQYKLRCNELIDATYERMELEKQLEKDEAELEAATNGLLTSFIEVLDRYAKHECGRLHGSTIPCTCGLDACVESIKKRITKGGAK